MSIPRHGGKLSIAAAVSAVMLAGTLTPANATQEQEPPTDQSPEIIQPAEPSVDEAGEDLVEEPTEEPSPEPATDDTPTATDDSEAPNNSVQDSPEESSAEVDEVEQLEQAEQVETQQLEDGVLLHEDFSGDSIPEGWQAIDGDWRVEDGRLVGVSTSTSQQARIVFGEHYEHYRFEATLRFDDAANNARWTALGLDMPTTSDDNWQQAAMRVESTAHNGLEFAQRRSGWNVTDTASAPSDIGIGEDIDVAVEVSGNRGKWFFDGELVMETNQLQRTADGVLGLVVNNSTVAFDDVTISEIEPFPVFEQREPGETAAIVAHRGDSSVAPENTMAAVTSAVTGGADYFEVDINLTADNEIVAIHDSTVDRTTDGSGTVRDMTYDQISQLDAGSWFDTSYSFAAVPTLEEIFQYMEDSGAHVLLEYKDTWTPEEVELTAQLAEEYDVADQIIAQSFDLETVDSLQEELPEVPRMILGAPREDSEDIAAELGAIGWNPSVNQVLNSPQWVDRMHDADLLTFVYTVNDADQWEALTELGVDGIITDHPGQLNGWNQRYAAGVPEQGEVASIVGHRGNSAVAPENTMPAIASSVATGVEYFEIDIEYTADDVIVAIHDGTVDRTTDGSGRVRDMTYEQISQLDAGSWFARGHGYSGVGVPTLEDVLEHMADSGAHMLLEYKSTWSPEKVELTRELIDEYDVADQIIAQSFDLTTVESLRDELPEVPRMILGAPRVDSEQIASDLGAIGWNPSVGQVLANPAWVERMHNAGLETYVYTVNNARQWEQLTELGVDGIITDYPDHLKGWNMRFNQALGQDIPEPEPTEPEPTEPEPTEPEPTEPEPTEPEPTEPEPTEPEPTEPEPTEPEPSEPEPTEPEPTEPVPTDPGATPPSDDEQDDDQEEVVGKVTVSPASVLPGGQVTVEAHGFDAGEDVEMTLNPTLATIQADDQGAFTAQVTIPEDIEPGDYDLTVSGLSSGNTGSVVLTVLNPATDDLETPVNDPVTSSGNVTGELAKTGANTTAVVSASAAILLLLGGFMIALQRRRTALTSQD